MIEEIINENNIENALIYLESKKNNAGIDGMKISDLRQYIEDNKDVFIANVLNGSYTFNLIQECEILNYKGKKRIIAKISSIDRLLLRCIFQSLELRVNGKLSNSSFAFQKNKGVPQAISHCKKMICNSESKYALCIDIQDFFQSIDHDILMELLKKYGADELTSSLIYKHLKTKTVFNMEIRQNDKGIVQGSLLSPLLSNIYLNELDAYLEQKNIKFCRYADDIRVFTKEYEEAITINKEIEEFLFSSLKLSINRQKSRITKCDGMEFLGNVFVVDEINNLIQNKRVQKNRQFDYFSNWHSSSIEKRNDEYFIINDGIVTQKDFTILFENEDKKIIIPSNVTNTLNIYSSITFSSTFFRYIASKGIVINMFDNHAECIGSFIPANIKSDYNLEIKQLSYYTDEKKRLSIAKQFAMCAGHNIRENLKYYNKYKKSTLIGETIKKISELIQKENLCNNVNSLMAYEGQIRINYYNCFNEIISNEAFFFHGRKKRPPKDPINALISFGNTLLYRFVAKEIYKSRLCIKIGYLHSTNKRVESLNLDVSELFRPIIVDRIIFSLINKGMINIQDHFDYEKDKVYLSDKGKRIFIKNLSIKMKTKIKNKNVYYSYSELIKNELNKLVHLFDDKEQYKGYKHFN